MPRLFTALRNSAGGVFVPLPFFARQGLPAHAGWMRNYPHKASDYRRHRGRSTARELIIRIRPASTAVHFSLSLTAHWVRYGSKKNRIRYGPAFRSPETQALCRRNRKRILPASCLPPDQRRFSQACELARFGNSAGGDDGVDIGRNVAISGPCPLMWAASWLMSSRDRRGGTLFVERAYPLAGTQFLPSLEPVPCAFCAQLDNTQALTRHDRSGHIASCQRMVEKQKNSWSACDEGAAARNCRLLGRVLATDHVEAGRNLRLSWRARGLKYR